MKTFVTQIGEAGTDMGWCLWLTFQHPTKDNDQAFTEIRDINLDWATLLEKDDFSHAEDGPAFLAKVKELLEPLGYVNFGTARYIFHGGN